MSDRSIEVLRKCSSPEFREDLEKTLISLLSKHIDRDITQIEGSTILEVFRIGRNRVDAEKVS